MEEDLIFYQYLNTLNQMTAKNIQGYEKIIRLFNEFISSNKNFKYNKTYLDDSISDFFRVCEIYHEKKKRAEKYCCFLKNEKFHEKLKKYYSALNEWYIVIDHLFLIDENGFKFVLEEIENTNQLSKLKKINLENELQKFNLHDLSKINVIKYYFSSSNENIDFTEKYYLTKENEMMNGILNKLKKEKSVNNSESNK